MKKITKKKQFTSDRPADRQTDFMCPHCEIGSQRNHEAFNHNIIKVTMTLLQKPKDILHTVQMNTQPP